MNEAPRPQFEDVADVVRYQMSRRSLVGGGAAAALTGLLAACSGGGGSYSDKPADNKPAATKSVQIGKANIPVPRDQSVIVGQVEYTVFDSFNGMIPNGSPGGAGVELATEPLFFLSFATGKLTPWLATEYKYNDDHSELTLKFDPKAHWNDGKPLTANDFKFTVMRLKDRPDLFGGGGDLKEFVKDVEVPDPQTAVVKLLKPTTAAALQLHRRDLRRADQHPARAHLEVAGPDEVQGQPAGPVRPVQAEAGDPEPEDVRLGEGPELLEQGQARRQAAVRRLPSTLEAGRPGRAGVRAGRVRLSARSTSSTPSSCATPATRRCRPRSSTTRTRG